MVMQDQSRRLAEPLRWTRAGRLAVIGAAALLLAALATVAVIAATNGHAYKAGCIEVTFATSLGGGVMQPCGAHARAACAHPAEYPAAAAHNALRDACRKAGLPYGRATAAG